MIKWEHKETKIGELKPYEKNPRTISEEAMAKLVRSIKEDGYHQRIICTNDGLVIGGHQRIRALKEAGYKDSDKVGVLIPDRELTEAEFQRINIRDNLQAGDWDMDILSSMFDVEQLIDWGMGEELFAFDEMPDFEPDELEQPRLDEKQMTECPNCGEIFDHAKHQAKPQN